MKKIGIVLFSLLILTGCTAVNYSKKDTMSIINETLSKEINLFNNIFDGFKFYAPRGLQVTDKTEYNCKILSNDYTYYLYADVISYHYKTKKIYEEKSDKILSKEINYDGKTGYIEITEINGKYFIEYMYNYSKIESYIDKENLNKEILNMTYILSTIKYNDKVIESIIDEDEFDTKEEKIDIFESKSEKSNFLEALEKYENYEVNEDEDNDFMSINDIE